MEKLCDYNALKNRRVLVTGHTGFKGSWLTKILLELDCVVIGVSNHMEVGGHFDQLNLSDRIVDCRGDICDSQFLSEVFSNHRPEIVFHLAAQALVRRSYEDVNLTYTTNVLGTVNVCDEVRKSPEVLSFICVTSDKCYENVEWLWGYRESDRLGGKDPYSASKAAAEIVFNSFQSSFYEKNSKLGAATVRAGNVIGGGDWSKDRIIPDCVRADANGENVTLRYPNATRPWQHVLEPLSGYLLLAACLIDSPKKFSESWNFGPDISANMTVYDVANSILEHLDSEVKIDIENCGGSIQEARLLQLNCDKAKQRLNWYPRWAAKRTLIETADWYLRVKNGEDVGEVTSSQIDAFFGAS